MLTSGATGTGMRRLANKDLERPATLGVVGKLRRRRHPLGRGVRLRPRPHRDKISKGHAARARRSTQNFWTPELSREAYPTMDEFVEDVAQILREEVEELVRLGARVRIQLDAPHYPLLLEKETREFYEARGWDLDKWLSRGVELDNYVIGGARTTRT